MMIHPLLHDVLVAALLVCTCAVSLHKPGSGNVLQLQNVNYRKPIFGVEQEMALGNAVDDALRDSERKFLDWAKQNGTSLGYRSFLADELCWLEWLLEVWRLIIDMKNKHHEDGGNKKLNKVIAGRIGNVAGSPDLTEHNDVRLLDLGHELNENALDDELQWFERLRRLIDGRKRRDDVDGDQDSQWLGWLKKIIDRRRGRHHEDRGSFDDEDSDEEEGGNTRLKVIAGRMGKVLGSPDWAEQNTVRLGNSGYQNIFVDWLKCLRYLIDGRENGARAWLDCLRNIVDKRRRHHEDDADGDDHEDGPSRYSSSVSLGNMGIGPQVYDNHNLTDGAIDIHSSLVLQQRVHLAPGNIGHGSVQKILRFIGDSYVITRVAAHDQQTNSSNSGYVRILKGGVGEHFLVLQLKSEPGQSLKYFVEVWGFNNEPTPR